MSKEDMITIEKLVEAVQHLFDMKKKKGSTHVMKNAWNIVANNLYDVKKLIYRQSVKSSPQVSNTNTSSQTLTQIEQLEYELEVYGIADDKASLKIVESIEYCPILKFVVDAIEIPDFVLYGEELERFYRTLTAIMNDRWLLTKKLHPEQEVQECDARNDATTTDAGNQNKTSNSEATILSAEQMLKKYQRNGGFIELENKADAGWLINRTPYYREDTVLAAMEEYKNQEVQLLNK